MIIDLILDRKDGHSYQPDQFYRDCMEYSSIFDGIGADICEAMDYGTEDDVRKALCAYITCNDYNPAICDYINSVSWLEESDDLDLDCEAAALRDWELSSVDVGDYMIDGDRAWKVTSMDHSTGEWRFTVVSPCGESYCVDAEAAGRCTFIGAGADWSAKRHVAELWAGHTITSRATYYVVEIDGTPVTVAPSFSQNFYESHETLEHRKRYVFFHTLAERYAFSDCSDDRILESVFDGVPVEYAGWQPGMLIEFREATTGLVVFSESFPEWDH